MFKDIMLPLDGSHFSELALPLAVAVARTSNARLHIVRVHVSSVTTAEIAVTANYDQLVRDWELDALNVAISRARDAGVEVLGNLLEGPVVNGLQTYVTNEKIDLVVMTTHGRSGIKRAVMGSVAEQCVRKTEVPILLLHPRSDDDDVARDVTDVKRILVTLDGSLEAEAVLPHAALLAQLTGAEIVLNRVAAAPFDVAITIGVEALREYVGLLQAQAIEYLQSIADRMPANVRVRNVVVTAERVVDGILRCAQEQDVDMIAMATHGRSGWARVAVGSVAETVLHRSTTPVMLVKGTTAPASEVPRSEQNEPAHSGD